MRVSLRQNAPGLAKKAYPPRSGAGKPTKKDFYGWLPGYVTYLQTTHKSLVTIKAYIARFRWNRGCWQYI